MLIYILKTKQHYFKMLTHIKSSKLLLGYTKICNHPKPPTTIHNYPKQPTNTHNHSQLPTITHNYPQPPTTPTTIQHDRQPPKNYSKKPRLVTNRDVTPL